MPTGSTESQFQAAWLSFHSNTYEWLVVSSGGTTAQFKGTALDSNGNPSGLMTWAKDDGADSCRIRIWSELD